MKQFTTVKRIIDIIVLLTFVITYIIDYTVIRNITFAYATIFGIFEIFQNFKKRKRISQTKWIKYFMIFPLIYLLQLFVIIFISHLFPIIWASYQESSVCNISVNSLFQIITLLIITPIREEYLFRYIAKTFNNNIIYYGISVILFSYLHVLGLNPILIFIRVPIDLLFAISYKKTEKLYVPVGLHTLNNIIPCIAMMFLG